MIVLRGGRVTAHIWRPFFAILAGIRIVPALWISLALPTVCRTDGAAAAIWLGYNRLQRFGSVLRFTTLTEAAMKL